MNWTKIYDFFNTFYIFCIISLVCRFYENSVDIVVQKLFKFGETH